MKRISRRAGVCAALAATGALAVTGTASAQPTFPRRPATACAPARPASRLFNQPASSATAAASGDRPAGRSPSPPRADGSSCATSTTTDAAGTASTRSSATRRQRPGQHRAVRSRRPAGQREHRRSYGSKQYRHCSTSTSCTRARLARLLNSPSGPRASPPPRSLGLDSIGTGSGQADGTTSTASQHPAERRDPQPPRQVLRRERRRPGLRAQPHDEFRSASTSTTACARPPGRS